MLCIIVRDRSLIVVNQNDKLEVTNKHELSENSCMLYLFNIS